MAVSPIITQAGNITQTWSFAGGGMTNHEVVVSQLISTNASGSLVANVTAYNNPIHYVCALTSVGAAPITMQLISNAV